jgi:hypothetical protein
VVCGQRWEWQENNEVTGYSFVWTVIDPVPPMPAVEQAVEYEVYGDYLCIKVSGCTCDFGYDLPHHSTCGLEPLAKVEKLLESHQLIQDLKTLNDPSLKTLLALAVQCGELREALARVSPEEAARLHAKHKRESAS